MQSFNLLFSDMVLELEWLWRSELGSDQLGDDVGEGISPPIELPHVVTFGLQCYMLVLEGDSSLLSDLDQH